jgi:hypothetical protein
VVYEERDNAQNPYAASQVESSLTPETLDNRGPEGIGGWLILPLLGLLFTPFVAAITLATHSLAPFTEGYFSTLTNPEFEQYHPLWAVLLILEPVATCLVGGMAVWGLVLLFRKAKGFPRFMIAYYAFNMLFAITDAVLGFQIPIVAERGGPELLAQVARTCIPAAIWIPYMRRSKRVKNTFVN